MATTGTACDDGDACTTTDSCDEGVCVGGPDETDPTITCPGDLEIAPTDVDGAVVVYDAPIVDDNCAGVTVDCDPASGGQFSFGETIVTCTATDGAGRQVSCAFAVTVLDVQGVIENLFADIDDLLDAGILNGGQANSLVRQLSQALRQLDLDRRRVACNVLSAFIHHVGGLIADGVLTEAEGLALIASAEGATAALDCDGGAAPRKAARRGRLGGGR